VNKVVRGDATNMTVEQALDVMLQMAQSMCFANEVAFVTAKEHATRIAKKTIKF